MCLVAKIDMMNWNVTFFQKHEPYLDIDYEELQNFGFVQSDEEEDNAEFSMINLDLLDLDFEGSDSVSNTPVVSTIIDKVFFPNDQFYEMCSHLKVNSICSIL